MAEFSFDVETGEICLTRGDGEPLSDYLVRQAEHDVRVANRAREIALMPGLRRRERALKSLRLAEDEEAELDDWQADKLRRLRAELDWFTSH